MAAEVLTCPSCGGAVPPTDRFAATAACPWCGQTLIVQRTDTVPDAGTALLADYPSRLSLACAGRIAGRAFTVLGRVRYDYGEGFWDEWYLRFADGKPGWLQEDEGEFALFERQRIRSEIPDASRVRVGQRLQINDHSVFISETGDARIVGAEGQLGSRVQPGEAVRYFEGSSAGRLVSVELSPNTMELSIGDEIDGDELVIDVE